jgi:hypothetical protein
MDDFKLKVVLACLTGIVFSLIFILLAFVLPNKKEYVYEKPKSKLEQISQAVKDK